MKKGKTLVIILVSAFLLINCGISISGQDKVSITAGIGFAETINLGVRYQVNNSRIGLSIGSYPSPGDDWLFDWEKLISVSLDYYRFFGEPSPISGLPPWYGRFGMDYMWLSWGSSADNNVELHVRLGRDIFITKDLGISLDAGVGWFIVDESGFTRVLPVLGICLFCRL